MADEWVIVAQGNSVEQFENSATLDDIPAGSPVKIIIDVNMVAYNALNPSMWNPFKDKYSAETQAENAQWWTEKMVPAQISITRVTSSMDGHIEIEGMATGSPLIVVIGVVAACIAILGVAWAVQKILVEYQKTAQQKANIDEVNLLISKGYTPSEISQIMQGINKPLENDDSSLFGLGNIGKYAIPAALIIGGVMLLNSGILSRKKAEA